jgi:hypothetical protein
MKSLDVNPPIGPALLARAQTNGIVTAVARSTVTQINPEAR